MSNVVQFPEREPRDPLFLMASEVLRIQRTAKTEAQRMTVPLSVEEWSKAAAILGEVKKRGAAIAADMADGCPLLVGPGANEPEVRENFSLIHRAINLMPRFLRAELATGGEPARLSNED